jgi:hypothetical protein
VIAMVAFASIDRRRLAVPIVAATVCISIGASVSLFMPGWPMLLVSLISAVTLGGLILRSRSGELDLFDPLVLTSASFFVFFVFRPLADLPNPALSYSPVDIAITYNMALVAALTAVVAFEIGYGLRIGSRISKALPAPPEPLHDSPLAYAGIALSLVALAALGISIAMAGGITGLLGQRGSSVSGGLNVPIVSEASVLATPAFLLLWAVRGDGRRFARLASVVPLAIILMDTLPRGDRRVLIPFVLAVVATWYMRRNRLPSLKAATTAVVLAFFLFVVPLRDARTGNQSMVDSIAATLSDPGAAVAGAFRSGDTEMIDTLALEIGQVGSPGGIPWQHGLSSLTETLLQPIPRQLWAGKPESVRNQIIQLDWGMIGGSCVSMCPTFSAVGSLYADFGLVSVFGGALVLGVMFQGWYAYYRRFSTSLAAQAGYAGTLFLPFFVWWAGLASVVIYVGLYLVPLLVAMKFAAGHKPRGNLESQRAGSFA